MKLRAEIVVVVQAADFATAAEHERRLDAFHASLREHYPDATFVLKERKERVGARRIQEPRQIVHHTGRLNTYLD